MTQILARLHSSPARRSSIALLLGVALAASVIPAPAEDEKPAGDPPAAGEEGQEGKESPKDPEEGPVRVFAKDSKEAEAEYERLRTAFDAEKELEPFERIATVSRFASAPCKKTVEFLGKLYSEEKNFGIAVAITHVLGKVGNQEAVKHIVTGGIPLLLEHAGGEEEIQLALSNPLEPKAEEWLLKNGLTPAVRQSPGALAAMLNVISRFKTDARVGVLVLEAKKAPSPEVQAGILESLRGLASNEKVAQLAVGLARAENPEVRVSAHDVLQASGSPKHRNLFLAGLKDPHWEMRVLCLDALADLKDKDLAKHSVPLLRDKESRVQVAAVDALLRVGGPKVMDPLIGALDKAGGRVRDDIADALARLTKKNFGPVKAQWESWWAQNKDKGLELQAISPEELALLKEEEAKNASTVLATPYYFGLRVLGKVAFVIDCSESMEDEYIPKAQALTAEAKEKKDKEKGRTVVVGKDTEDDKDKDGKDDGTAKKKKKKKKKTLFSRLDLAKKELLQVLKGMKDGESFDIFRFSSETSDFIAESFPDAKKTLVKLDPEVRGTAEAYIKASEPGGLTNIMGALKSAFQYPELETVFLLSDGAPTVGITDPDQLLRELERMNRRRKVKINVISFHPSPAERKLLHAIALRNQGVYVEK